MAANGEGRPARLAASSRVQIPYSWSRDGRFLAYQEQGNVEETYILPLDGGAKPWRWLPEGVTVASPAFSPDGRWAALRNQAGMLDSRDVLESRSERFGETA
jgi:Tol biopolymer transport system component